MSSIVRMNETYSLLSWLYFGTKVVGGLILGATILLYANQDKLLYFPNPPNIPKTPDENPYGCSSPGEWGKNGKILNSRNGRTLPIPFEDHMVSTDDGEKIHTWLMLQDDSEDRPTLIYFHGNAANMGFRLQNAAEMYAKANINILMMDYRGFGKSSGVPNERGLQLDGEAVLRYAKSHPRLKNSPIVVFGRSLGGAVSFYLAEKFPSEVAAVIVENTFLSISAMVDIVMPFLRPIKPYVLRIKWDSDEKISRVKQPILFISGDSDQLVPPFHMKALYDLAIQSRHKDFFTVLGGTHNDTWERGGERYYIKLRDFLSAFYKNNAAQDIQRGDGSAAAAVDDSETKVCGKIDSQTNQTEEQENTTIEDESNDVEDEDYMVVEPPVSAIPTMDSNFQVR